MTAKERAEKLREHFLVTGYIEQADIDRVIEELAQGIEAAVREEREMCAQILDGWARNERQRMQLDIAECAEFAARAVRRKDWPYLDESDGEKVFAFTLREQAIIQMLLSRKSDGDIAGEIGIEPERLAQIKQRMQRKLEHSRSLNLPRF